MGKRAKERPAKATTATEKPKELSFAQVKAMLNQGAAEREIERTAKAATVPAATPAEIERVESLLKRMEMMGVQSAAEMKALEDQITRTSRLMEICESMQILNDQDRHGKLVEANAAKPEEAAKPAAAPQAPAGIKDPGYGNVITFNDEVQGYFQDTATIGELLVALIFMETAKLDDGFGMAILEIVKRRIKEATQEDYCGEESYLYGLLVGARMVAANYA